jgi:uncharacterized protein (UPF0332 family)
MHQNKMSMSFDKTESQLYFESLVTPLLAQGNIKPRDIVAIHLVQTQINHFQTCLKNDSKHFFFKGVFSLLESLNSIENNLYSWTTVKIYYSVFYLLRASLATKGVGLFRWGRDAFYLGYDKPKFQKMDGLHKSDHKGVIFLQQKYYSTSDNLLQSKVEGEIPYYWLMDKREFVNYKHKTFKEPDAPEFWKKIKETITQKDINYLIDLYLNDTTLSFCFDEEHSILATPLQRLKLTCRDFENSGESSFIESNKLDIINLEINRGVEFRLKQLLKTTANSV